MKTIFIVAGDQSGDSHAAKLMIELSRIIPNVKFIGIGGEAMEQAGLRSLVPLSEISVVGFWEVAKRYVFFKKLLSKCEQIFLLGEIDCFIPVDYPGFNLRLSAFAKKSNIPVHYYIAPQLWAWGESRAKKLAAVVDKLLVVFPFEVGFFKKFGIETEFVGHPLLDNEIFLQNLEREKRIALLPGSRLQEIKKHIPIMSETVEIIKKEIDGCTFGIAVSPLVDQSVYKKMIPESWEMFSDSRKLMKTSSIGIVKTGTSTLEAALCGLPFVMMYKTSAVSYLLAKNMVRLPYISLVNILINKPVVPELIQQEANPRNIAKFVVELYHNKEKQEGMKNEFLEIRSLLGNPGASRRAAESIAYSMGIQQ
ncbi:MAG: lipid-A-disaccharide synthase [Ignavibacteriae bacterium]|nr:lipid-A-disaccharide synthase [Ignavibacteriota bacterium]